MITLSLYFPCYHTQSPRYSRHCREGPKITEHSIGIARYLSPKPNCGPKKFSLYRKPSDLIPLGFSKGSENPYVSFNNISLLCLF